ncbi:MAG TPA: DNA polymerase IV [Acidimicrobiia bacterium]|nr:DNA polymerase IV [Acidimicrobiia bacterium]
MGATILHCDLDAFYASVEQVRHPELAGQPVLVGGGVVLAASYEARQFGISAPMPTRKALELCPWAVVVDGSFSDYLEMSRQVFEICGDYTPAVEQISIDEAFLQVSGARRILGEPIAIAHELRERVRRETGLALSVGVASTKFLAKIASAVAKPDGLVAVPEGEELEFLHPLPVSRVWGVGPVLGARLAERGVLTVGDLAKVPEPALASWLGSGAGRHLHALAWNRDPRAVVQVGAAGSIGSQSAIRGTRDPERLSHVLLGIAERVARRLRAKDRAGRTITVRVRFSQERSVTRARTLTAPVATSSALHRVALSLLADGLAASNAPVTLVAISVSRLSVLAPLQLELPVEGNDPVRPGTPAGATRLAAEEALDRVRERFGKTAAGRASLLLDKDQKLVPDEFRHLAERDR